jgi:hypothetical protein
MVFFWICSDSVDFLELFRQCGIFWNCSDSVVIFGTVPTVWYFLELFRRCGIFWNCSDSVDFLELFRQCGIFVFHFNTLHLTLNNKSINQ